MKYTSLFLLAQGALCDECGDICSNMPLLCHEGISTCDSNKACSGLFWTDARKNVVCNPQITAGCPDSIPYTCSEAKTNSLDPPRRPPIFHNPPPPKPGGLSPDGVVPFLKVAKPLSSLQVVKNPYVAPVIKDLDESLPGKPGIKLSTYLGMKENEKDNLIRTLTPDEQIHFVDLIDRNDKVKDKAKEEDRARPRGTRGFDNPGQVCYFNSALQILVHAQPFVDLIMSIGSTEPLWTLFQDVIRQEWDEVERVRIHPTKLREKLAELTNDHHMFVVGFQHDASEALNHIIEHLSRIDKRVEDLFRIKLTEQKVFPTHTKETHEDRNILMVAFSQSTGSETLESVLSHYQQIKSSGSHDTKFLIAGNPSLLLIQVSRNDKVKVNTGLIYPMKLQFLGRDYELRGLILQAGTTTSGHYISNFFLYTEGAWYEANDWNMSPLDSPSIEYGKVALLMYQRIK
jgi:hypothetical protein